MFDLNDLKFWLLKLSTSKSTQYTKLAPNALWFTYCNLKSRKPHEQQNKKQRNARFIDEKLKTKSLMFFVSFFFM